MAGPAWDGSDKGMANEDMTKHNSNIDEPTALYLHLPHFLATTPFLHAPHNFQCVSPHLLNLIFKLHILAPNTIGPSHLPWDLGVRSLRGEYCYAP